MDLTLQVDGVSLNIRVAVLLQTEKGYLFERHKDGYYFAIGGRVKAGESSLEAAMRELQEEVAIKTNNLNLVSIVENFYVHKGVSFQEICFVYTSHQVFDVELPENIVALSQKDMKDKDIRPEVIKNSIAQEPGFISHSIVK